MNCNLSYVTYYIFHLLESLGSARIEGNNTTLAEYIETKLEPQKSLPHSIREISNIEETMDFVEGNIKKYPINRMFISELHKKIVNNLPLPPNGEGDRTPGDYRKVNVRITNSAHQPPDNFKVEEYMQELFDFIQHPDSPKYDLLKVAIAHHRFVWIHPFSNGNGRTVRLFTYAMLIKLGFGVEVGRILNPTAVFCSNRHAYTSYLSEADTGRDEGILNWCEYVLKGLKEEIEKIDKLTDYKFLKENILIPAINYSLERQYINEIEEKILMRAINSNKQVIQAGDLKDLFVGKAHTEISRQIKKLITKKMLMSEKDTSRKYLICFDNSYLLRGVIKALGEKGFLPIKDET